MKEFTPYGSSKALTTPFPAETFDDLREQPRSTQKRWERTSTRRISAHSRRLAAMWRPPSPLN